MLIHLHHKVNHKDRFKKTANDYTFITEFVDTLLEQNKLSMEDIAKNIMNRVQSQDYYVADLIESMRKYESVVCYLTAVRATISPSLSPLQVAQRLMIEGPNYEIGRKLYANMFMNLLVAKELDNKD